MGVKVLLADDSGVMRKIISRSLKTIGVDDIVEADDGASALELFGKDKFDMVLTDCNMPHKNGLDVVKAIRQQGSSVPVILIATEAKKSSVLEAIQAGASDYLAKPFDDEVLREKLQRHVGSLT